MNEYTARCMKLDTYRDISRLVRSRDDVIKTRSSTRELGIIYDYEEMIDEAVVFASSLVIDLDRTEAKAL